MSEVKFLPPAAKFIKKLKDRKLKELYKNAIQEIAGDYTVGKQKNRRFIGSVGLRYLL